MNTNKVMLATLVATAVAMAFAVMPALIQQQASADPAPKSVEDCKNRGGHLPEGQQPQCKNDNGLTQECIARNPGQAKQNDCEETAIVNP